jgi:hypothetical protein
LASFVSATKEVVLLSSLSRQAASVSGNSTIASSFVESLVESLADRPKVQLVFWRSAARMPI